MSHTAEADSARLFAVACPGCHGHVAVTGDLAGHAATCPLCAAAFLVPVPVPASTEPAPHDEPLLFAEPPPPSTRRSTAGVVPATTAVGTALLPAQHDEHVPAPPPAEPPAEFAFREPIKTVRSGGTEIELRRLTPEERRVRRARRSLIMLVIGAAILAALVVTLGKTGR